MALTALPAAAAQNVCVSTTGAVRVQMGTAHGSSVAGPGNVAIARSAKSTATAGFSVGDRNNRATATGDNSEAFAGIGNGSTATATGKGSGANVGLGDGNTATADIGDNNTATASSPDCTARATGGGATDSC